MLSSSPRIAVVIPAYNEGNTIGAVARSIRSAADVIVVNDGSTDDTARQAAKNGAIVFTLSTNRGYDHGIRYGLQQAIARQYDIAITIDADGQHDDSLIPEFIEKVSEGAAVVVGIRPRFQRLGERIFASVSRVVWGLRDPLCGMKAYCCVSLKSVLDDTGTYDSVGTEPAIALVAHGHALSQVPIPIRHREDAPRFGSGLRANKKILLACAHALRLYVFSKHRTHVA